jgi:ribose 5-phosphate isomerase B
MRVRIATDHGGFELKEDLKSYLRGVGHDVVDIGARELTPGDDYPDFVIPLARAVAAGMVDRGLAVCGSGVGASVCATRYVRIRFQACVQAWCRTTTRPTRASNMTT